MGAELVFERLDAQRFDKDGADGIVRLALAQGFAEIEFVAIA